MVPVFRISKHRSLLAAILVAMALSACGDGEGPSAATAQRADEVMLHGTPAAQAQDAAGKRGLDNDPRAKPLLLQLRCRLSRCSLIMRLKRSGLLRALLK